MSRKRGEEHIPVSLIPSSIPLSGVTDRMAYGLCVSKCWCTVCTYAFDSGFTRSLSSSARTGYTSHVLKARHPHVFLPRSCGTERNLKLQIINYKSPQFVATNGEASVYFIPYHGRFFKLRRISRSACRRLIVSLRSRFFFWRTTAISTLICRPLVYTRNGTAVNPLVLSFPMSASI